MKNGLSEEITWKIFQAIFAKFLPSRPEQLDASENSRSSDGDNLRSIFRPRIRVPTCHRGRYIRESLVTNGLNVTRPIRLYLNVLYGESSQRTRASLLPSLVTVLYIRRHNVMNRCKSLKRNRHSRLTFSAFADKVLNYKYFRVDGL